MRTYRPARGVRRRYIINPKRIALIAAVIAAAILAILFFSHMGAEVSIDDADREQMISSGVFIDGVSVGGVPLGGLTYAQGKEKVEQAAREVLSEKISFTVKGALHSYTAEEAGLTAEIERQLDEAMMYGKEGTRWDLNNADPEPKDWPIEYVYNPAVFAAILAENAQDWGEPAVNASYTVEKESDPYDLTTNGKIVTQEPKDGWEVNIAQVENEVQTQMETLSFQPFVAQIDVVQGKKVNESGELIKMGAYTTRISGTSTDERKYNIWRMSDELNGSIVRPGEVFSINDTVGDRTVESGWKLAPGIENGMMTDQAGGGICQVSSTMYNAALRAEMEIVARVPHTIMSSYVDPGMDATISSGGPDFKMANPYDEDILVIIKCDIPDMRVTVELYGPKERDYYLLFESELIDEDDTPSIEYVTNPSLPEFDVERIKGGQGYRRYQIYAQKYDKATDQKIGERYQITTTTYADLTPLVEVGPGIPLPARGTSLEEVYALAAQLRAEKEAAQTPPPEESEQPAEPAPEQPAEPAPEQPAEPAPEQPAEPAPEQPAEPGQPAAA